MEKYGITFVHELNIQHHFVEHVSTCSESLLLYLRNTRKMSSQILVQFSLIKSYHGRLKYIIF